MPVSDPFFHGASSGSYGNGPCTGGSSSEGLQMILFTINIFINMSKCALLKFHQSPLTFLLVWVLQQVYKVSTPLPYRLVLTLDHPFRLVFLLIRPLSILLDADHFHQNPPKILC